MSRDPHQAALIAAAPRCGVAVQALPDLHLDAVRYSRGDRSATVLRGRVWPHLSAVAEALCDDKHACKQRLAEAGVRVPRGRRFEDPEQVVPLLAEGGLWVVKPLDGTHGEGVVLGVRSRTDVVDAHDRGHAVWLIEEQIDGEDLRLQAIGGRLVAACRREPAGVVGDGQSTLAALIEQRRSAVRAANPRNDLVLDDESSSLLLEQGLGMGDVPARGRSVLLHRAANMATGGRAVDLTDSLHPAWSDLVTTVSRALELTLFAVDAVTPDPSAPPTAGAVIEVNARPEWLHHTFSEGRSHDVAALLFEDVFEDAFGA